MDVVREETLLVEDCRQSLSAGVDGDGLLVLVAVCLDDGVEAFFQRVAVGGEPDDGEDDGVRVRRVGVGGVGADCEEFGGEACVDVVARGGARVAGEDREV